MAKIRWATTTRQRYIKVMKVMKVKSFTLHSKDLTKLGILHGDKHLWMLIIMDDC